MIGIASWTINGMDDNVWIMFGSGRGEKLCHFVGWGWVCHSAQKPALVRYFGSTLLLSAGKALGLLLGP